MLPPMHRACFLLGIALVGITAPARGGTQSASNGAGAPSLVGTWSFDGTARCRSGRAWILSADGTYSEVMLPDLRPLTRGRWNERNGTIVYSLARPGALSHQGGTLSKRMKIVERSANRLIAISNPRVRHVMHRCG